MLSIIIGSSKTHEACCIDVETISHYNIFGTESITYMYKANFYIAPFTKGRMGKV